MYGIREIMAHPWVGRIKVDKILKRELEPPYVPDPSKFNFDLQDIKSNLESIEGLLQQDRKNRKFSTCFSKSFTYTSREVLSDLMERLLHSHSGHNM